jgi:hypothetical protein
MTRKSKKSYPTTIKQAKELVYYDPRVSVIKLGIKRMMKCFPEEEKGYIINLYE